MALIEPLGACGHYPEEMPGIERVTFVAAGPQWWRADLYDDQEGTSLPIALGEGYNMAHALASGLVDHNMRQGQR